MFRSPRYRVPHLEASQKAEAVKQKTTASISKKVAPFCCSRVPCLVAPLFRFQLRTKRGSRVSTFAHYPTMMVEKRNTQLATWNPAGHVPPKLHCPVGLLSTPPNPEIRIFNQDILPKSDVPFAQVPWIRTNISSDRGKSTIFFETELKVIERETSRETPDKQYSQSKASERERLGLQGSFQSYGIRLLANPS